MSDSNGDSTNDLGLSTDVSIELGHLLLVYFVQFGLHVSAGIHDIFLEKILFDW